MRSTIRGPDAAVNRRLRLTTAVYFFTDQLTVWTFKPIAGYPSQYCDKFAVKGRRYLTIVSLPDHATAKYLDRYHPVITRVEGAASFLAANQQDNDANKEFITTHLLIKHWRQTHYLVQKENTVYFMQREDSQGRRRRGKVVALYNDRPCKKTQRRYCTKLEIRIQGSAKIAEAGIHSCVGAVGFNWREYFEEVVRFCRVDFGRLSVLERKRANRYGERRVVQAKALFERLARVTLNGETKYCVQEFVKVVGSRGSCLVDMPVLNRQSTAKQTKQRVHRQRIQRHRYGNCNEAPLTRHNDRVIRVRHRAECV